MQSFFEFLFSVINDYFCPTTFKVVMNIQKLHPFCNRSFPGDGPKSGREYFGNKQLRKIYQSIPTEYNNINTAR